MKVKVQQTIGVYEVSGEDVLANEDIEIGIDSHWNSHERIVLNVRGVEYTVLGHSLITAIQNAMNTG